MPMRVGLVVSGFAVMIGAAAAQTAKTEPAPQATLEPAPRAKLEVVTGQGLFDLRIGKSVDLTKNQWLLTFVNNQFPDSLQQGQINISVAGQHYTLAVGDRLDLKQFRATEQDARDKDKCYVDLIEVVAPKGAPATATFRFYCL